MKQTPMWAGRAILLFAILLAPSAGLGDDACAPAQPPMATGETTRRAYGASSPRPICPVLMRRRQHRIPRSPQFDLRRLFLRRLPALRWTCSRTAYRRRGLFASRRTATPLSPRAALDMFEVFRVDETNAKSVSSQPARAGPTNELLWLRSFHVASAFPSGGFASPEGGAFTTPVV